MTETITYKGKEYEVISEWLANLDATVRLLWLRREKQPLIERWELVNKDWQFVSSYNSLEKAQALLGDRNMHGPVGPLPHRPHEEQR